ncbi:MAG: hypothetical protein ACP6IP_01750 [Candidatus Njordarchaeia archaeon]
MSMDERSNIFQLRKLMDPNVSQDEKLAIINSLSEVEIDYFENNIKLILQIAEYLEDKCLNTYLEPECALFKVYLSTIAENAGYAFRKGYLVRDYVANLFKTKIMMVPDNIKLIFLGVMDYIVKTYPEVMLELRDVFEKLLREVEAPECVEKIFSIIGNAAWSLPQVIVDYIGIIEDIINERKDENIEKYFYVAVSKAARRNYYVVKSIVSNVIEDLYTTIDASKLIFLANIEIPPDHMDQASSIFDLLEVQYRSIEDKELKKLVILVLSRMAKNRDFYEIQEKFNKYLIDALNEELDKDIKLSLIKASAVPYWNHRINLDELINMLAEIGVSAAEEEDVRIAAINALFKISLLPYVPKERIINGYMDVLYESGGEEPKNFVLDYIPMLMRFSEARSHELLSLLIEFVGRVEEEDFLRIKAADILVSLSKSLYNEIIKLSDAILDVWKIATEWTIRDSIVKLAGELLIKAYVDDKNLLTILVEALKDTYIYREALTYLYMLSRRMPEIISRYTDEVIDTYKTISSVEEEMLEIVEQEGFSEDYYFMVETPKRIIPRILINIINAKEDLYDRVVDSLLDQFENEINELILREIAFALSQAYRLNEGKFKQIITKHLLRKERLELLKEFGVIL